MQSKLPFTETSIFTIMSKMAKDHGAINLSQGFPDFEVSKELIEGTYQHMRAGRNQYAPMPGIPLLQERIADKVERTYGLNLDATQCITVTGGATEANYCAISALVHPGDEVILFEPAYDSYEPVVLMNGGIPKRIKMQFPKFSIPWGQVNDLVSSRTKLIIINSPHNPTGTVLGEADMCALSTIVEKSGAYVLSDEVYEHIIFDGKQHESILKYEKLKNHAIAVFSFGKTFHATGWKVGYVITSPEITREIRQIHQFLNFSVNTPIQWALADYLSEPAHYEKVSQFYQKKRDLFLQLTASSRFRPVTCFGTYFQLMGYADITDWGDRDTAAWLTRTHGIASIPVSVFYHDRHDDHVLRFCFAKTNETLEKASEILCRI